MTDNRFYHLLKMQEYLNIGKEVFAKYRGFIYSRSIIEYKISEIYVRMYAIFDDLAKTKDWKPVRELEEARLKAYRRSMWKAPKRK